MSPPGMVSTGTTVTDPAARESGRSARTATRGRCRGSRGRRGGRGSPARRGHLAQRLAVAGHVGHHDQHVPAQLEGQVLGDGQRDPRGEHPLDHRVVGRVEEQQRSSPAAERPSRPSRTTAASAWVRPIAAKTTENGSSPTCRLGGDLRGELQVRQAGDREDRQLLPAHQGGQGVDGGDARSAPGRRAARGMGRVEGPPGPAAVPVRGRRPAVEGARRDRCTPVPASPAPTGMRRGAPLNRTQVRCGSSPRCPRAPGRRPGRGPPRAPGRAGRPVDGRR